MHNKLAELQAYKAERCPGNPTSLVGGETNSASPSKKDFITQILEGTYQGMGSHTFVFQNQCLVCQACGACMLKNSATDKLKAMVEQKCWNEAWIPPRLGKGTQPMPCGDGQGRSAAANVMAGPSQREKDGRRTPCRHVSRPKRPSSTNQKRSDGKKPV